MRTFSGLVVVGVLFLGVSGTLAAKQGAATPAVPAAHPRPTFTAKSTVRDLMDGLIDPFSDFLFDAVGETAVGDKVEVKRPTSEAEWSTVREGALAMIDGARLLAVSDRHMARPGQRSANPLVEQEPAAMDAMVAADPAAWVKLAEGLGAAGAVALRAADARDANALGEANDRLDAACENCHLKYWYPDQLSMLAAADAKLRKAK